VMHGHEKSDPSVVAMKPVNEGGRLPEELVEPRGGAEGNAVERGTRRTPSRGCVSPGLDRVREAAKERKQERFTALLHHIGVDLLQSAYGWLRKEASAGVDGVTWEEYGEGLERKLADLHGRIHRGAYRAGPSGLCISRSRTDDSGRWASQRWKTRLVLGLDPRIVQRALVEVLNAIWEEDFLGFSYGFQPGRGQHDALDALAVGINRCKVNWILDADIAGFFDAVSHEWLIKFVEHRVGDRRVVRLIRKWLKAGVAEDGEVKPGTVGTPPAFAGAGSRCGDLATTGEHLPALRLRPVG